MSFIQNLHGSSINLFQGVQTGDQIGFTGQTNDLVLNLARFEKQHRRYIADPEPIRKRGIIIDVDLYNADGGTLLFSDFVQDRGDHSAGATPSRPEVNEDWDVRGAHRLIKSCFIKMSN
jgi:hypothetical protein